MLGAGSIVATLSTCFVNPGLAALTVLGLGQRTNFGPHDFWEMKARQE